MFQVILLVMFQVILLVVYVSGDPTGCHVVIVDDLVQTGGTLIESAKVRVLMRNDTVP